ncbi:MAG: CNNM domain-containing protein [Victivallaceae bacterium]|nr:CNNM domain-containing protein [Victivallaceae bacterium]
MIWLFCLLLALAIQAFFSGCETGFVSLQRPRIHNAKKQGCRRASMVDVLLKHPSLTLAVTLLGTNISIVCASMLARKFALWTGLEPKTAFVAVPLVLTLVMLTIEIIPKNWFRQAPDERLILCAPLLYVSCIILFPFAKLLSLFTERTVQWFAVSGVEGKDPGLLLREDFRLLLRDSERAGIIDSEAADILDRSVDFYKLKISDVMTRSEQVKFVNSTASVAEAVETCRSNNLSRLVVFDSEANSGNTGGIFSIYDAIFDLDEALWDLTPIGGLVKKASTVFADESATEVLVNARREEIPLLMVIDRSSGQQLGVVTPVDVAKQIFA